ncbi:MAG: phosphoribosylanthranilate isomerase [Lachnospiraceae bacterium]|nr:phosphoribosylanthranilate isomerase [Lachnospiraceae bacterium]
MGEQVRIKICGLRTPGDVTAVNAVRPDFAGFIFDPTRKRYIVPEAAEALRKELDPAIRAVGVFVNADVDGIMDVLRICRVTAVQLHGQESDDEILELREADRREFCDPREERRGEFQETQAAYRRESQDSPTVDQKKFRGREDLLIIKAFKINTAEDVRKAEASAADLILLDHGAGGTGESFDWSLLGGCRRPFILAGGLSPDNVAAAIQMTHPWGVDVSSSLETDGHKDPEKVRKFVKQVRGTAQN